MMSKIPVREMMIPVSDYGTIDSQATVKEAIKILQKSFYMDDQGNVHGHTSLFVTNEKGKLVGILTIRSILKSLVMFQDAKKLPDNYLWAFFVKAAPKSASDMLVKNIMRKKNLAYVNVNDDAMIAVRLIVEKKVNTLPVEERGKVVGMLRSKDLFGMIGELL